MAVNSSKILPMLPPVGGNRGNDLVNEKIDEKILRLLRLEDVFDLDYDTYVSLLKERIAAARMTGSKIPIEEDELLVGEFRRIKGKVGRFKVTPKKVSASSFKKGTSVARVSKIKAISGRPASSQKLLAPAKGEGPGPNYLQDIISSLGNIIKILQSQFKLSQKSAEEDRKNQEKRRRTGIEEGLEKSFGLVKKAAKAIIAPVSNILQDILNYFLMIFVGRALVKLLRWFTDPNNRDKIKSIGRFLKDWWPTLMAAYILFGTGFGKVVRKLAGVAVRGIASLGKVLFKLGVAIARGKSLKTAAAFAGGRSGLGGGKGRGIGGTLLKGGLAVAGTLAAGAAIDYGVNKMMGGDQEQEKVKVPDAPEVGVMKAAGGGLASLSDMFKGAAGGAAFGPLGMLLGAGVGSGKMGDILGGLGGMVTGKKGTDKVPAMLTEGEFVMSKGAVQKYGVQTLEAMNAAGGGTNKPKVVKGSVHAAGGGYIGPDGMMGGIGELRRKYDAKHGEGAYDRESARRRAAINNASDKPVLPPLKTDSEYVNQLRARAKQGTSNYTSVNGIRIPGVKFDPNALLPKPSLPGSISGDKIAKGVTSKAKGIFSSISAATGIGSGKLTAEQQKKIAQDNAERNRIIQSAQQKRDAAKKARAEYAKIISNPDDPRYQDAWDGKITVDSLKVDNKSTSDYKPYVSRFAGARDAAFERARGITGNTSSGFNPFASMGRFNPLMSDIGSLASKGMQRAFPSMSARQGYAASKGKYYSSSDQKTYGNYNDAMAAKKSRMTSLASQQGLNKLSYEKTAGQRYSRGKRFDTESLARTREDIKRGGFMGQLGRLSTRVFGGEKGRARVDAADKASAARVKQAGAASIGRYYSSSDGKYYKDYNAAKLARDQRKKSAAITPTPKPKPKVITKKSNPAGGGMGGGRGGSSKPPSFKATSASHRRTKNQYGIK